MASCAKLKETCSSNYNKKGSKKKDQLLGGWILSWSTAAQMFAWGLGRSSHTRRKCKTNVWHAHKLSFSSCRKVLIIFVTVFIMIVMFWLNHLIYRSYYNRIIHSKKYTDLINVCVAEKAAVPWLVPELERHYISTLLYWGQSGGWSCGIPGFKFRVKHEFIFSPLTRQFKFESYVEPKNLRFPFTWYLVSMREGTHVGFKWNLLQQV